MAPEQRAHPVPGLQQPQGLLVWLGLPVLRSRVPRRNLNSQRVLMKMDLLGPGLVARVAPSPQQTHCLLMKLDFQVVRGAAPRQNPHLQCRPVILDLQGPGSRAVGTTGTAEGAADAKSVSEARPRGIEKLGVFFRAWTRVNTPLWKARVRSGSEVMLPRPL